MPEFSSPFVGNDNERKLTKGEIIRAIRFSIAAEFEAIQIYEQIAESIDNKLAKEVLLDVVDEEKEHVGEFMKVLRTLSPEEFEHYEEGEDEVEERFM